MYVVLPCISREFDKLSSKAQTIESLIYLQGTWYSSRHRLSVVILVKSLSSQVESLCIKWF